MCEAGSVGPCLPLSPPNRTTLMTNITPPLLTPPSLTPPHKLFHLWISMPWVLTIRCLGCFLGVVVVKEQEATNLFSLRMANPSEAISSHLCPSIMPRPKESRTLNTEGEVSKPFVFPAFILGGDSRRCVSGGCYLQRHPYRDSISVTKLFS